MRFLRSFIICVMRIQFFPGFFLVFAILRPFIGCSITFQSIPDPIKMFFQFFLSIFELLSKISVSNKVHKSFNFHLGWSWIAVIWFFIDEFRSISMLNGPFSIKINFWFLLEHIFICFDWEFHASGGITNPLLNFYLPNFEIYSLFSLKSK